MTSKGYIYLVDTRELMDNDKIYKIGKAKNLRTLEAMHRNSMVIVITSCENTINCKKELLEVFTKKFIKHVIGKDYFIGDKDDMASTLNDIVRKHR